MSTSSEQQGQAPASFEELIHRVKTGAGGPPLTDQSRTGSEPGARPRTGLASEPGIAANGISSSRPATPSLLPPVSPRPPVEATDGTAAAADETAAASAVAAAFAAAEASAAAAAGLPKKSHKKRRKKAKAGGLTMGRVLAAGVNAGAFDEIWQHCLGLTEPDPKPPRDPTPKQLTPHSTPSSSDLEDEMSEEEDEQLSALLTIMPGISSTGPVLQDLESAAQTQPELRSEQPCPTTPLWARHVTGNTQTRSEGGTGSSSTPPVPQVSTSAGGVKPPAVSSTLLRLARLKQQMPSAPQDGTMFAAMFAAAHAGAESLDPYTCVRASADAKPATPMSSLLPWNTSTRAQRVQALASALDTSAPGWGTAPPTQKTKADAAAASRNGAKSGSGATMSRPQSPGPAGRPVSAGASAAGQAGGAEPPATTTTPNSVTVAVHGSEVQLPTNDPNCSASAQMVSDMVNAAQKVTDVKQAAIAAAEELKAAAAGKKNGRAGQGKGTAAFMSAIPAAGTSTVKKAGAKKKDPTLQPIKTPVVRKSGAEVTAEKLQLKMALAEAKQQAVRGSLASMSPLRAKTNRPLSALTKGARPTSATIHAHAFQAVQPAPLSSSIDTAVPMDSQRQMELRKVQLQSAPGALFATPAGQLYPDTVPFAGSQPLGSPQVASYSFTGGSSQQMNFMSVGGSASLAPVAGLNLQPVLTQSRPSDADTLASFYQRPTSAATAYKSTARFSAGSPMLAQGNTDAGSAVRQSCPNGAVGGLPAVSSAGLLRPGSALPGRPFSPNRLVDKPAWADDVEGTFEGDGWESVGEDEMDEGKIMALNNNACWARGAGEAPVGDTNDGGGGGEDAAAGRHGSAGGRRRAAANASAMLISSWDAAMNSNLVKATRAAREMSMLLAEEADSRGSGPADVRGEAARLLRRYQMQAATLQAVDEPNVFNLCHCLRSIDQVVALSQLLPQLPNLNALVVAGNDLGDGAMAMLVAGLHKDGCGQVAALDASNNNLTTTSVKAICPLTLEPPSASDEDPSQAGIPAALADILRPASAPNKKKAGPPPPLLPVPLQRPAKSVHGAVLQELLLGGNVGLGDTAMELLAAVLLQPSCVLRVLDLGKCGLSERGAALLSKALPGTKCLQVLDMGWNSLGVKGAAALADGLRGNSTIKQLHLPWTGIKDTGCSHIVSALATNGCLELLDLSGNGASNDTCIVLQGALKTNKTLSSLILRDSPLGLIGARRLLQAVHNLKGGLAHLDLMGCSFQDTVALPGDNGKPSPAELFNPVYPDAQYTLDLKLPAHMQVAKELLLLADQQGLKTWKNVTLNGEPFKLRSAYHTELPTKGVLSFTFTSLAPVVQKDTPMSDQEFDFVWNAQVYQQGTTQYNPYASTERDMARASVSRARSRASTAAGGVLNSANGLQESDVTGHLEDISGPLDHLLPGTHDNEHTSCEVIAPDGHIFEDGETMLQDLVRKPSQTHSPTAPREPVPPASIRPAAAPTRPPSALARSRLGGASASTPSSPVHLPPPTVASSADFTARAGGGRHVAWNSESGADSDAPTGTMGQQSESGAAGRRPKSQGGMAGRASTVMSSAGSVLVSERGLTSGGPTARAAMSQIKGVTDQWKMSLLGAITSEATLMCSQMVQVVDALHDSEAKLQAAIQCFGKLSDPENLHLVTEALGPNGATELLTRIGELSLFHPANPTGNWQLQLSHPVAATVAKRLLVAATQQHDLGLCRWPFHTCLVQCSIDGEPIDTEDPHKIKLPREGLLRICFVDLRPVPATAQPFTKQQMSVLIAVLTKVDKLDGTKLVEVVDAAEVNTVVDVLQRWGAAAAHNDDVSAGGATIGLSSHVASLRAAAVRYGLSVGVKDLQGLIPAIRRLALDHYVTCDQLMELLSLLPYHASLDRVELCCCFWARTVDRAAKWTDVMRRMNEEQQVLLAQRLGYCNIFNAKRPSLHYRLRMFRPDEHEIAWQLFNMAVDSPLECFTNVFIDGEPKIINEGASVWPVLRGSAKDGTVPTCTIEFDFTWPEEGKTDAKLFEALKERLTAAKEALNRAQGTPAQGNKQAGGAAAAAAAAAAQLHGKAKLLAVPLRTGISRPTSAAEGSSSAADDTSALRQERIAQRPAGAIPLSGAVGPRQKKMTQEDKEQMEGVVLTEDGQLKRRAIHGQMKFFGRVASNQAPNVAARALWMSSKVEEEVGMFGYHLSHAGGFLLDRTTSTRLKAPVAAVASGALPSGMSVPWTVRAPSSIPASIISHQHHAAHVPPAPRTMLGAGLTSASHLHGGPSKLAAVTEDSSTDDNLKAVAGQLAAASKAQPGAGWGRLRKQHNNLGSSGIAAVAGRQTVETIPE